MLLVPPGHPDPRAAAAVAAWLAAVTDGSEFVAARFPPVAVLALRLMIDVASALLEAPSTSVTAARAKTLARGGLAVRGVGL